MTYQDLTIMVLPYHKLKLDSLLKLYFIIAEC